ncbi:MAG: PQQ-binding-like beta-propeller repeat protein [Verrucomicrobiota bacterium]|jgi:outer membrane protein assembly factor BamB
MRSGFCLITSVAWLLLPLPAAGGEDVLTNEWTLDLHSYSDSAPAVGQDGTIYCGTWNGMLWAITPDGRRKWVFPTGNEIKSAPAVGADGTVYFGSRDRKFYAVRPDGQQRWEFPTGGWVDSSPALARDGAVYFGSWDKNFYALNSAGKELWRFSTAGEIVSSPAIGADGTIYFGSHDKKLYALTANGRKKWEFATGGSILSSPALNQDQCLYFTSVDGCLYALNLDGSLRWRLRTGSITESSPVIGADGTIYLGVQQHLWAISADGRKKWGRVGGEDYPFETSPVVLADGSICCVSRYGMLCYCSPEGDLRYMNYLTSYGYGSPAVGPSGAIYVPHRGAAAGCGFTALRAGAVLARTPWPRFRGNARNTGHALDVTP